MPPAIEMFAALLDRSILDITAATQDARNYDPVRIYDRSNVWDNNTVPFVRTATAWRREQLARTGLAWMADYGGDRRRWMIDTVPALAALLPAPAPDVPDRDHHGNVRPPMIEPITNDSVSDLGLDYDRTSATVASLAVQRTGGSLHASLIVRLDRRYRYDDVHVADAELHLDLRGVTDLRFDPDSGHGLSIVCDPHGVAVGIGDSIVRATGANGYINDQMWHLSEAGRAAEALTPPATPRVWRSGPFDCRRLSGWASTAAFVLHTAMIEIRSSRHHLRRADVDISAVSRRFHGAGGGVVDAARRHGPARERAFRDLVQTWITHDGGLDESSRLWDVIGKLGLHLPERLATPARPAAAGRAEIIRVTYGSRGRFTGGGPREVDVHAAVPAEDGTRPWRLARITIREAQAFRITDAAFHRTVELENTAGSVSSGTDGALLAQA